MTAVREPPPGRPPQFTVRFEDDEMALAGYLAQGRMRNLRPNTLAAQEWYLRRAAGLMGRPLLTATRADLALWQASMAGLAVKSQLAALSHVRVFYKWALAQELIDRDPTVALPSPRRPRMLPRPVAEDDLKLAIDTGAPDVRLALVLAGYCGLRACEIVGLTADAAHPDTVPPYLEVREGKGGHQRIVPLPAQVWDELRRHGICEGPVLRRRGDTTLAQTAGVLSTIVADHFRALQIPATLHQARHRYGTQLYAACRDIRVVQELMGHTDPATTAGYVAYSEGTAQAAAAQVAGSLGAARAVVDVPADGRVVAMRPREPSGEQRLELARARFADMPTPACPSWCEQGGGHPWAVGDVESAARWHEVRLSGGHGSLTQMQTITLDGAVTTDEVTWTSPLHEDVLDREAVRARAAAMLAAADWMASISEAALSGA